MGYNFGQKSSSIFALHYTYMNFISDSLAVIELKGLIGYLQGLLSYQRLENFTSLTSFQRF